GAFSAPLLAVFVLGLFVRRTTATGVLLGTFAGAVVTLWFTFAEMFSDWFSLWVFVVGFVSSVVFSLLLSLVPGLKLMPDGARDRTYWAVVRDGAVALPEAETETETEASGSR
ncbi:MAG: hypothetical protein VX311_16100, partial [Planctomycetota bacterium]|nr:hypothetical protein [Planctomycetota bacterium]